jgi:hypothetical protein
MTNQHDEGLSRRTFCLKHNNTATNGVCAICGNRTEPVIGLEVFVEGTWAELCETCIDQYAPDLAPHRGLGMETT